MKFKDIVYTLKDEVIAPKTMSVVATDLMDWSTAVSYTHLIIIVWLNIESLYLNACNALSLSSTANLISSEDIITSCEKLYTDISACSSSLILWFTFDNYYMKSHITCGRVFSGQIERLNIQLYDTFKNFDNIIFINLNHLIAEVGLINTYDSVSYTHLVKNAKNI